MAEKHAAPKKVKPSLFGGFSDPTYITTDPDVTKTDPYIKSEPIPSRYLGNGLSIPRAKKGKLPNALFSKKWLSLVSPEQNKEAFKKNDFAETFEDPGRSERRAAAESKKHNIDPKDFRYVSPSPKTTGPGSLWGTFQALSKKPFEHMPDYAVVKRGESPERPKPQPKNIVTSPAKKGTYGFIGTTFDFTLKKKEEGKNANNKPPVPDPYGALRKAEKEAWEAAKKKNLSTEPFRVITRSKMTFDEKTCGASAVYDAVKEEDLPKESKKKNAKTPKAPEEKKAISSNVFRYASAPKTGIYGCLNPFPNCRVTSKDKNDDKPDLYDCLRLKRKEEKEKGPKPLAGEWKPVSGSKTAVVRSLLKRFY